MKCFRCSSDPCKCPDGQTVYVGDCREVLRLLPDESVNCCVTSPPYYGLRDYGSPGQVGLETSPQEYIAALVEVFREVRRVLRSDGVLWLNLGDSYANDGKWGGETSGKQSYLDDNSRKRAGREKRITGLRPKNIIGIPWRLAFALQDDGWCLRQDLIWFKPNGLTESVRDRCTKSHEYLFLLSKSARYHFDYKAIEEPVTSGPADVKKMKEGKERIGGKHKSLVDPLSCASSATNIGRKRSVGNGETRRKRSVWVIPTQPYKGAHFATFPRGLVRPCVLAGCPPRGLVLDPFVGSGTTLVVARKNGCRGIGIELNPEYAKLIAKRLEQRTLFTDSA